MRKAVVGQDRRKGSGLFGSGFEVLGKIEQRLLFRFKELSSLNS